MTILWIFFGSGRHKTSVGLRVVSMHFGVFSKGQDTEWGYFLG